MEKVLVSACLLGKEVRYDGGSLQSDSSVLKQWLNEGRVVSTCPEFDSGMTIPRAPAEISKGDGLGVWNSISQVKDITGKDVTGYFVKGAQIALELCKLHNLKVAVLAEGSPSCGSSKIYDGSFTGKTIEGVGVTTALLREHGIKVFSQHDLEQANQALVKNT
ncbi:DUF523 domain-containing protein [Reinekea sp.]|uniref:DUF523 domain-containing protein n=1 Tax=Reinekea sp. TaxID=1970455 RepID=UPI003989165B